MLKRKKILVCVTGGIAAYKAAELVSGLGKLGAEVRVVMTDHAREFITPLTFQALSGYPVATDLFDPSQEAGMGHLELARWTDLAIVAPATANFIAKAALGLADDLLTTTMLAVTAPILVCPAMNVHMYKNPAVADNLYRLRSRGTHILGPAEGPMACGEFGPGRLVEPAEIIERALDILGPGDLEGHKVMITAGPTRETIDPVRFLSNRSSGRMGIALAREARRRGAKTTLVLGPTEVEPPIGVEVVRTVSAADMHRQVTGRFEDVDVTIMSAAVADYRPSTIFGQKIKKATADLSSLDLERTDDILAELGQRKKQGQVLVGFAAETDNLVAEAKRKLEAKNLDLVVGNNVALPGAGFASETNIVVLVDGSPDPVELPVMSKTEVSIKIFDRIADMLA